MLTDAPSQTLILRPDPGAASIARKALVFGLVAATFRGDPGADPAFLPSSQIRVVSWCSDRLKSDWLMQWSADR
jgi:hypothetical protein